MLAVMEAHMEETSRKHKAECLGFLPGPYCTCTGNSKPWAIPYFEMGVLEGLLVDEGTFNGFADARGYVSTGKAAGELRDAIEKMRRKCGTFLTAVRKQNGAAAVGEFVTAIQNLKRKIPPKVYRKSTKFWCQTNTSGGFIDNQPVLECMSGRQRCESNSFTVGSCTSRAKAFCFKRHSAFSPTHYACSPQRSHCRLWYLDDKRRGNAEASCATVGHSAFIKLNGAD